MKRGREPSIVQRLDDERRSTCVRKKWWLWSELDGIGGGDIVCLLRE